METKEKNMNEEAPMAEEPLTQNEIDQVNQENGNTEKEEMIAENEENDSISNEELLDKANTELLEYKDKYLRLMAEFDNYRKRVMKEKTDLILNGGERVLTSILPVLDDFERAEANMVDIEDVASLKEGVSLVIDKLKSTLERGGLKKFNPVGEVFDVNFHEAIAMVPGQPEELIGKVIDCVQAGYMLNDKVIRHAKVAVAEK